MPSPSSFSSVLLGTSLLTGSGTNLFYGSVMVGSGNFYPLSNPSGYYPSSNPSGYLTSSSGVVMTTGNQIISGNKTFAGLITGTSGSINLASGLMSDSSYINSINWNNRNLLDNNSGNSVDWNLRELHTTTSGFVSLNWENRIAYNTAGSTVIDWENHELNEGPGTISIDWQERKLYTDNGIYSTAGTASVDWSNRILYDFDNVESVDWSSRRFVDDQNNVSLEWQFRELLDENEATSVKWHVRELKDTNDNTTVDWGNSYLYGLTGGLSVDWSGRLLKTTGNLASVDWSNRILKDDDNDTVFDWRSLKLYGAWDAYDGITSSNLGSDWGTIGNTDLVTKEAVNDTTPFILPIMQYNTNTAFATGVGRSITPFRTNPFSDGFGTIIPYEFTKFRVSLYLAFTTNPSYDLFPVYVRFNKPNTNSTSTYESLHGTRQGTVVYPDVNTGLTGTLTDLGAAGGKANSFRFVSSWVTIPSAWQANATSLGFYEILGVWLGNDSSGTLTDNFNDNHGIRGMIEFKK